MSVKIKSVVWGVTASLAMALFYLAIMFLTMSGREVWENFTAFWYLLSGIIIGFGVQIGLWAYLRQRMKEALACAALPASPSQGGRRGEHTGAVSGVSGATSGTAMLACCAHHAADLLPVMGLSGAALFLSRYQRPFLILGLSINLLGIAYMVKLLQKHNHMGAVLPHITNERG